jgi:hypothetical protein
MNTFYLYIAGGQEVFRPRRIQYSYVITDAPDYPCRNPTTKHGRNAADQPEFTDLPYKHLYFSF